MAFQDLAIPEAVVGESACKHAPRTAFDRLRIRMPIKLERDMETWEFDEFIRALTIEVDDVTYSYNRRLGAGSAGVVYLYIPSAREKPSLALKFSWDKMWPDKRTGLSKLPKTLGCNVVKTAHFMDAKIMVMELGNEDLHNVNASFEDFCNETMLCLLDHNLVCPDWKLDNITAFSSPCGDGRDVYRVIDVEGITAPNLLNHQWVATYHCLFLPECTKASTEAEVRKMVATLQIQTAYAIEMSKILYEYRTPQTENMHLFYPTDDLSDIIKILRRNNALKPTQNHYSNVIKLLEQLKAVDTADVETVIREWFVR